MAAHCRGVTATGNPCRRPPSKDRPYCTAHDPERVREHAAISSAGGKARHDPETLTLKSEVRELMGAMRSGEVSAGVGSVLLQAIRLLREMETPEDPAHTFIESIRIMRESAPDLSEPANDPQGDIPRSTDDTPEWQEHVAKVEAEQAERERIRTAPLDQLTRFERRQRLAGQRS